MVCIDGVEVGSKGNGYSNSKPPSTESNCEIINHFENAFRAAFLAPLPPHVDLTIDELLAEFMRTYGGAEGARHELAELFGQRIS